MTDIGLLGVFKNGHGLYPGLGSEGMRSSVFWVGIVIGIGSVSSFFFLLFIGRQLALFQRSERVFTFHSLFLFTSFYFLLFSFSASCSLSGLHGRSGRVSLPSAPQFRMFAPMSLLSVVKGDETIGITGTVLRSIRSDQSKQSNEKNNSKQQAALLSLVGFIQSDYSWRVSIPIHFTWEVHVMLLVDQL